jgi:hypothetical protein
MSKKLQKTLLKVLKGGSTGRTSPYPKLTSSQLSCVRGGGTQRTYPPK